ncbi:MAG: biopolymer transporter ExbD [Puniceicoccales bacterium]|jgi:biopolymer transport protein ExbD|nr:biopolymer transporter ExbD [Puniceicoccales bacterium]
MALCEFQSHRTLEKPDTQFDTSAIVAVVLFIFGLSLLGSRFVFSPGIEMQIPKIQNVDLQATSGVLNIGPSGLLMFNNRILKLEELSEEIEIFLSHKKLPEAITLLICIDRSVPFGLVAKVVDTLKTGGCAHIQIACDQ